MANKNGKSDVKAKQAYKLNLEQNGYTEVQITGSPTDLKAKKDGQTFYFEIKMTKQSETYFGAATLTEWAQAFKTPNFFKFVIAKTDKDEEKFTFIEFSPTEFMEHSTIPPFKIYFNISLTGKTPKRNRRKAIPLTDASMKMLCEFHDKMRE
jgi:hypothetical protein